MIGDECFKKSVQKMGGPSGKAGMFYSLVIPDILLAKPIEESLHRGNAGRPIAIAQRIHASMTAKKPTDSQGSASRESKAADEEVTFTVTQLYERFRRPIHSYIYRLLGSIEDADDLTQEVFLRAHAAWNNLYDRDNLSAWLYRIATNLCVDLLRRRKRISWWPLARFNRNNERFEDGADEENTFLQADSGGIPEIAERDLIRLTLMSMPEEYAVALVLSAAQGISYQEIAVIVGISPNAAATRISRAKRMFAEQYQRLNAEDAEKQEKRR